jgi:hypothetical protein
VGGARGARLADDERAKLTAADGAAFDQFGAPLTISRHTLVVGAPFATLGGNSYQGAAYVFSRGGSGWTQQAKLTAPDGAKFDGLGTSVAISHGTIVAGASGATINGNFAQGAAYLYQLRP